MSSTSPPGGASGHLHHLSELVCLLVAQDNCIGMISSGNDMGVCNAFGELYKSSEVQTLHKEKGFEDDTMNTMMELRKDFWGISSTDMLITVSQ